ncbi:MAG: DoxX family protein [Flavobacteriales bacterium]|nr:DoxX family protein [Flavobacteriales bacterium]
MFTLSNEMLMLIINVLCVAFFTVLLIQSGVDKLLDWEGNLSWLTGHFKDSLFSNMVPLLLGIITVTELGAGLVCAYGVVELLVFGENTFARIGIILSAVNLLMLFVGQRIAKEYAGAAVLALYFLLSIVSLFFLI